MSTIALEATLGLTVGWSLFAYGGSTPASRSGLAVLGGLLAVLWVARQALVRRARLGPDPPSGAPLAWPLGALGAWAGVQLLLPTGAGSVDPEATLRAIALLTLALVLHLAAATVAATESGASRRDRWLVVLGLGLALSGLASESLEGRRLWPQALVASSIPFGPFWYRNHFAACMVLITPLALGQLNRALARAAVSWRSTRPGSRLARAAGSESLAVVEWALPPLAMLVALVATTSRGAPLALAGGLLVAGLSLPRRSSRRVLLTAVGVPLILALAWVGPHRLIERLEQAPSDAPGRLAGWSAALELFRERPATGWGLNAYPAALAAHPDQLASLERVHAHLAFAAHNDYLGTAAESGFPGLTLLLWAGAAALWRARSEPWRFASLFGGLLHAGIDFDFQQPALVLLFSTIAAPRPAAGQQPAEGSATLGKTS